MRSFDIVNTELVIMELLILATPLILLYFPVRKAVRGGVRDAGGSGGLDGGESGPSAPEVLDRRYARGETTREEYLTIRDDIMREQNA